ncbi:putative palmitoyltransferase ZDHHC4 [Lamellibrachia satsuma]|nr:putative palmitoyltransferase ZDHHC4 [Lamellibrachia satsuma]
MDFLFLAVLYSLLCGLLFSCYLLKDSDFTKRGTIGYLRTAVSQLAYGTVRLLLPTWVQDAALYVEDHVFFQRNCCFQVFYVLLMLLGHFVVIVEALPYLYKSQPDFNHVLMPMALLTVNMVFFVMCSWSDPGVICKDNHSTYTNVYEYDGAMYKTRNVCPTCHFSKPARSKHCAIYNKCIFKFDHYCLWVNNAVGGLNHRYFLAFLLSLIAVCFDGVLLIMRALLCFIEQYNMWNLHYLDSHNKPHPITIRVLAQSLFLQFPRLVILNAVLILTTVVMTGFIGYHMWLVATNATTNERYKRYQLSSSNNPYNRGLLANIAEEFFLKRPNVTTKIRKRR